MKQMVVIGNIGQDAQIKTHNGKEFVAFSVAHSEKDAEGNDRTDWFSCTMENVKLAQYLLKGTKVYVQGKPWVKKYTDGAGKFQIAQNIHVEKVQLLSAKKEDQAPADKLPDPLPPSEDDLPF